MKWFFLVALVCISPLVHAQEVRQADIDSLKQQILKLNTEVSEIQLNMDVSQKKFQKGILVATIGYTVTIAGGLMLGRKYDDAGKVLLVTGGITGITGTFMMVDAFRYLSPKGKKQDKRTQ
jgi:hypothetical protein